MNEELENQESDSLSEPVEQGDVAGQTEQVGPLHRSHSGLYFAIFLMLCALTALSFWIANSHLMDNRAVGWLAMMAVSMAKALLVIMFFMHLWWERAWKYVLTIPALIMGVLLVVLLVPDVGMRTETYSQERTRNAPEAVGWSGSVASRLEAAGPETETVDETK